MVTTMYPASAATARIISPTATNSFFTVLYIASSFYKGILHDDRAGNNCCRDITPSAGAGRLPAGHATESLISGDEKGRRRGRLLRHENRRSLSLDGISRLRRGRAVGRRSK